MSDDLDDELDLLPDEEEPELPAQDRGGNDVADDYRSNDEPRPRNKPAIDNPKYGQRLTRAQRNMRVGTVATMILNGYRRHDIHNYVNDKLAIAWGGLSERGIDRLIANAKQLIESEVSADVNLERNKAKMRLEDLYRKANGAKLYGTALRVQKIRHGNDPENPLPAGGGGQFIVLIQEAVEG
jgi:hypothetical protein